MSERRTGGDRKATQWATERSGGGIVFAVLLLMVLTGCSTFPYEWRQAARKPQPTNDITGRWEGRWLSDVNGHNGRLRCLLTRREDGQFDGRFHATYRRFLRFGYDVVLHEIAATNGTMSLAGSADLGWPWGGYECDGTVSVTNFVARYRSKYDRGTFRMSRPAE